MLAASLGSFLNMRGNKNVVRFGSSKKLATFTMNNNNNNIIEKCLATSQ